MILKLALDMPEDVGMVQVARLIARTLLTNMNVDEGDVGDLELLVGELCTNVVRHADSDEQRYRVALEFFANHVELTVEDRGKGFSFKDVPEAGTPRPDTLTGGERIGGFGMRLVEALADRLEFRRSDSQGTTVCASVDLHYKTPDAERRAESLDTPAQTGN
jgi:serine/threonine-protein kinase RsbW